MAVLGPMKTIAFFYTLTGEIRSIASWIAMEGLGMLL